MNHNLTLLDALGCLGEEYIILRIWPDFPSYLLGSDIGILVIDLYKASKQIQEFLIKFTNEDNTIKVEELHNQIHIDFLREKKLVIRFGIIDSLDIYSRFHVQDSLKTIIFLTRTTQDINNQQIYLPSTEMDYLIRYFEYLQWFEQRPDKIKHMEYILANSTEKQRLELIENAHRFLRWNHSTADEKVIPSMNSEVVYVNSKKQAIKELVRLIKYLFKK